MLNKNASQSSLNRKKAHLLRRSQSSTSVHRASQSALVESSTAKKKSSVKESLKEENKFQEADSPLKFQTKTRVS